MSDSIEISVANREHIGTVKPLHACPRRRDNRHAARFPEGKVVRRRDHRKSFLRLHLVKVDRDRALHRVVEHKADAPKLGHRRQHGADVRVHGMKRHGSGISGTERQ